MPMTLMINDDDADDDDDDGDDSFMCLGWYEGERMQDGKRGWFPAANTIEIENEHVRMRNIRRKLRMMNQPCSVHRATEDYDDARHKSFIKRVTQHPTAAEAAGAGDDVVARQSDIRHQSFIKLKSVYN